MKGEPYGCVADILARHVLGEHNIGAAHPMRGLARDSSVYSISVVVDNSIMR